jgi:hypothetical protein
MNTLQPLLPEPSSLEAEIAIEKRLKLYNFAGTEHSLAELFQAGGSTLCSEIHKFINPMWNRDEMPLQWKEFIIVPIYKKDVTTDCSNYRGISLLPATHKILYNILLSSLTPYVDKVIGDHQGGF